VAGFAVASACGTTEERWLPCGPARPWVRVHVSGLGWVNGPDPVGKRKNDFSLLINLFQRHRKVIKLGKIVRSLMKF
jgi:hypothetical protein